MKSICLLSFFVILCFQAQGVTYTTTQDGDWGDPTTWGGVYVSAFFPTPVTPPNWFKAGVGDIIIINHDVNMNYEVFIRSPDVLIINVGGSLSSTSSSIYNLSPGAPTTTFGGIQAGVFVSGSLSASYIRNSTVLAILDGTMTTVGGGDFDNFGDLYVRSALNIDNNLNHNSGTMEIDGAGTVSINSGSFYNRSILSLVASNNCIETITGGFNNLLGGHISGAGVVVAQGDIDNSANPLTSWVNVEWCNSSSGVNVPAALEDCTHPCGILLPIELIEFSGNQKGEKVLLTWITASEINNDYFTLECSKDGEHFEKIGTVSGSGTSSLEKHYSFVDEHPTTGISYYRLSQSDYNGSKEYFEIVSVNFEPILSSISLYPNPTRDYITLITNIDSTVEIYDQLGRSESKFKIIEKNDHYLKLDISSLQNGSYILRYASSSFSLVKYD